MPFAQRGEQVPAPVDVKVGAAIVVLGITAKWNVNVNGCNPECP